MKIPTLLFCALIFGFNAKAEGILVHEGGYACCVLQCGAFALPINPLCVPLGLVTGMHPGPMMRKKSNKRKHKCHKHNPLLRKPTTSEQECKKLRKKDTREGTRVRKNSKLSVARGTATLENNLSGNELGQVLPYAAAQSLHRGTKEFLKDDLKPEESEDILIQGNTPEMTNGKPFPKEELYNTQFDILDIRDIVSDTMDQHVTASVESSKKPVILKDKPTKTSGKRGKESSNKQGTVRKPATESKDNGPQQNQRKEKSTAKKRTSKKTLKPETSDTHNLKESPSRKAVQTNGRKPSKATGQHKTSPKITNPGKKRDEKSSSKMVSKGGKQILTNTKKTLGKEKKTNQIDYDFQNDPAEQANHKARDPKTKQVSPKSEEAVVEQMVTVDDEMLTHENTEPHFLVKEMKEPDSFPDQEASELLYLEKISAPEDLPMLTIDNDEAVERDEQQPVNTKEKFPKGEKQWLTNTEEANGKKTCAPKVQKSSEIDHGFNDDPVEKPNRKVSKRKQQVSKGMKQIAEKQLIPIGDKLTDENTEPQSVIEGMKELDHLPDLQASVSQNLGKMSATEDLTKVAFGKDDILKGGKEQAANNKKKIPTEKKQRLTNSKETNVKKKKARTPKAPITNKVNTFKNDPVEQPKRKIAIKRKQQTCKEQMEDKQLVPIGEDKRTDKNTAPQSITEEMKEPDSFPDQEASELPNLEKISATEDFPMLTIDNDEPVERNKQQPVNTKVKLPKVEKQRLTNTKEANGKTKKTCAPKVQKSNKICENSDFKNEAVKQPNRKKKVTKEMGPVSKIKKELMGEHIVKNGEELSPLSEKETSELPHVEKIVAVKNQPMPMFSTEPFMKEEEKLLTNSKDKLLTEKKIRQPNVSHSKKTNQVAKKETPEKAKRQQKVVKVEKPNNKAQVTKEEKKKIANKEKVAEEKSESQRVAEPINCVLNQKASKPIKRGKTSSKDLLGTKATQVLGSDIENILPPEIVLQDGSHLKADSKEQTERVKSSKTQALGKVKESKPTEEKDSNWDSTIGSDVSEQPNAAPELNEDARSKVSGDNDVRKAIIEELSNKSFDEKVAINPTNATEALLPRAYGALPIHLPHVQKPDTSSSTVSPNLEKAFEELARLLDTILQASKNQPDENKLQESNSSNKSQTDEVKKETSGSSHKNSDYAVKTTAQKSDQDAFDPEAVEAAKLYKLAKELPNLKMKSEALKLHTQGNDTKLVEGTQTQREGLNTKEQDPQAPTAPSPTTEMTQEAPHLNRNVQLRKAIRSRVEKMNKARN